MSVFTNVNPEDLLPWLRARGIHRLDRLQGISGGAVNTNYWVDTEQGPWVLTLVEDRPAAAVRPVLALMQALADAGLPVPEVRAADDGETLGNLYGKPATLVRALPGSHPEMTVDEAHQAGAFLAQLHAQTLDIAPIGLNFGPDWQQGRGEYWLDRLPADDAELLRRSLATTARVWANQWPTAWLHADLFPDNVLIHQGQLSAVIDWYFASRGPRIWDLAVALNAWGGSESLSEGRCQALWEGYSARLALTVEEVAALPAMRQSAALRFWLSRLDASAVPRSADSGQITLKSPAEYRQLLLDLAVKVNDP